MHTHRIAESAYYQFSVRLAVAKERQVHEHAHVVKLVKQATYAESCTVDQAQVFRTFDLNPGMFHT